jgi:hypothetical protein
LGSVSVGNSRSLLTVTPLPQAVVCFSAKQGEKAYACLGCFVARKGGCRSITGPAPPFRSHAQSTSQTDISRISINYRQKRSIGPQRKRRKMMPRGPNRQRRYVAVSPLARIPDRFSEHGVKLALGEFLRLPHYCLPRHHLCHRAGTGSQQRRPSLRHRPYLGVCCWRLVPALQAHAQQLGAHSVAAVP